MTVIKHANNASITSDQDNNLNCDGDWTLSYLTTVETQITKLPAINNKNLTINGEAIDSMDSTGAWILYQLIQALEKKGNKVQLNNFSKEQQSLLKLIKDEITKTSEPIPTIKKLPWVEQLGKNTVFRTQQCKDFITFLGEITVTGLNAVRNPHRIQWKAFLNTIDETGFRALTIVALLNFLIGVVLAYQMGQQLKVYGANIYIVSFLGIGVLQEFAPLITAIIVAGRTSSAFTAQIGTMQVNEEIDALRTMGLSPIDHLVLPKIFGLMIALPLLFVWGDIFGLLGGMIASKRTLDINFYTFITTFPRVIQLSTFFNGLIKAPVFALIIAAVGCFQGFRVSSSADSVGWQTTKSVVQAIFIIIVADAIFSIILPWQNI